jgi:hypothetical protein
MIAESLEMLGSLIRASGLALITPGAPVVVPSAWIIPGSPWVSDLALSGRPTAIAWRILVTVPPGHGLHGLSVATETALTAAAAADVESVRVDPDGLTAIIDIQTT